MRTYVLGDKMIDFEFLSDQNQNFPDSFHHSVNYEDLNLNVSIPVFSIHGNHDDISGIGRLSSMDILSSTGFLNYFGKWRDLSEVEISPIVLQKNATKIGLYGLSHIHDARLARLFRDKKVKIRKPDIPDNEIFNLMVLHQNRADRGRFNYLPEDKLPGFIDFVVWGHEHDCRIEPEQNAKTNIFVSQPGSSVATSLSEGESIEKKIGILEVAGKNFKMTAVKLKTVRPFIFRSVNIDDFVTDLRLNEGDTRTKITKFFVETIEKMIDEAKKRLTGHNKQPQIPLIRLRVMYTDENHCINTARFGQTYEKRVANPESVLVFKKFIKRLKTANVNVNNAAFNNAFDKKQQQDTVEDVIESYFNEVDDDNDKLDLFALKSLSEVCRLLVTRDDEVAAGTILQKHYENAKAFVKTKLPDEEEILAEIHEFQKTKSKEAYDEAVIANSANASSLRSVPSDVQAMSEDDDNDAAPSTSKPTVTAAKGRGRGRGSRGGAAKTSTRGRGKAAAPATPDASSSDTSVRKSRSAASKQTTSAANKKKNTIYANSSESD